jgi:hypothetical protein
MKTTKPKRGDRIEFYRQREWVGVTKRGARAIWRNDHRWRRIAPNGEIVGASTEGYRHMIDCKKNAFRCMAPCEVSA